VNNKRRWRKTTRWKNKNMIRTEVEEKKKDKKMMGRRGQ
jgi:hypothetical protein